MAQQHINYSSPNDGLGDTLRDSQIKAESNFNELYANKVDKVTGKGLSDTNFTQAEKDKLAGLVAGGQLQSDFTQGDNTKKDYIKNKPENTSDFNNDGDGVNAFVTDVGSVGTYARSAGEWVEFFTVLPKTQFVADGISLDFDLGSPALARAVFWNGVVLNDNDWSQLGNILTLTFTPANGDIIKPI